MSLDGPFCSLRSVASWTYRALTLKLFSDALARHALSIQDVIKVNNRTHVPTLEHYHNSMIECLSFAVNLTPF